MKVLVHDGFGVWLTTRRLNQGKFVWGEDVAEKLDYQPVVFTVHRHVRGKYAGETAVLMLKPASHKDGKAHRAYLKDVMERLPTWPNSRISELLPHNLTPAAKPPPEGNRRAILDRGGRMLTDILKKSDGVLCKGIAVKYAWIAKHRGQWPVGQARIEADALHWITTATGGTTLQLHWRRP